MFGTSEPKLNPLSDALRSWSNAVREAVDVERIHSEVVALPAPRNRLFAPDAMIQAEAMILEKLTEAGWLAEKHPFAFDNIPGIEDISPSLGLGVKNPRKVYSKVYKHLEGSNIVATKKGIQEPHKAIVIIGHHDTVNASPGANDNTASVVAILELARVLKPWKFRYSVILAMPDMEEIGLIGARALAKNLIESYELLGVINFETMSYTSTEPNTQILPPGLDKLYGGQVYRIQANEFRGDFTCLIYNGKAKAMASMLGSALNFQTNQTTALFLRDPNDLPFIGKLLGIIVPTVRNFARSDHARFWEMGIPALMVTDTANFRYKHYHQPSDTPEKVDYQRVADIVAATATVVAENTGLIQEL